jgi:hypothetical protein
VRRLEKRVHLYDREVHDFVFMRDPEIVRCLEPPSPAPAPDPSTPAGELVAPTPDEPPGEASTSAPVTPTLVLPTTF